MKIVALTQGLMQQKSGGVDYQLLLLLMALLTRDVAVLEEVSFGKPDKILPHGVLVACKQVPLIEYILPSVWLS